MRDDGGVTRPSGTMDFGIMFFASAAGRAGGGCYRLLLEAARFADAHGFISVWTPERHFHEFGGLFPNPSVTSAALATITERVELRAGSLISPLHHPVRIAEEWAVVDNLSGGRAAIAFGSGWNVADFVFHPDRYERRREIMFEQIDAVRRLWRGAPVVLKNTYGRDVEVVIQPPPVRSELPVWVTSSGNVETFVEAGRIGAHVLTHLIGQDIEALQTKIVSYRDALEASGFDRGAGRVSLMLHTFLGDDADAVKQQVRGAVSRVPALSGRPRGERGGGRRRDQWRPRAEDRAARDHARGNRGAPRSHLRALLPGWSAAGDARGVSAPDCAAHRDRRR